MIEKTEDGTVVVSGQEDIRRYDILAMRASLGLEVKTGMVMRHGFSIVAACVLRGYVTEDTRSKVKAYAQLDALAVSIGSQSRPVTPKGKTKTVSAADAPKAGRK